ncbi:MAG: MASE1 domain-containing protein, partial [Candidatus Dormibacteraeota bacterium]|nr:MASE1 domain-containing protein [Candidatus Dormibacteraeota bacterium]
IAVAAFFLYGSRVWTGVLAGALLANITNGAAPLDTSIGIAAGDTVAPLLAGYFLRRVGFRGELDRVADVVNILAAGLLGMLVSATLGTTVLWLTGELAVSYGSDWTVWWIGDAMGVIIYAPAILTFVKARNNLPRTPARQAEGVAFLIAMPVAAALLMASVVPLWYIIIPCTLWGALRFRQPIAALSVALVSSASIVVLVNGYGPFSYTSLEVTTRLVTLQLFNATLALTIMLLTAVADERSKAWDELKSAAEDLEDRVRERSDELVRAQRSIADANERESASLRVSVQRISHLESIKSDFLRLASHELRGPIGIVRGYVEMLLDGTFGKLPETMMPAMSVLEDKAAHMGRLVDRMLETARLEGEHPPSERRPIDMTSLLHRAVDSTASTVTRHFFVVDGDGAPEIVIADPEQIATVLTNLLDNAVRYSPDGGEIHVRVAARDGSLSVAVSDVGIGIAEEDIGRLFKSFSRVVTADNASIAGTGLGLYISRKLALLNGGDLCVSSVPGEGSTFTLTLPLARDPGAGDTAATS